MGATLLKNIAFVSMSLSNGILSPSIMQYSWFIGIFYICYLRLYAITVHYLLCIKSSSHYFHWQSEGSVRYEALWLDDWVLRYTAPSELETLCVRTPTRVTRVTYVCIVFLRFSFGLQVYTCTAAFIWLTAQYMLHFFDTMAIFYLLKILYRSVGSWKLIHVFLACFSHFTHLSFKQWIWKYKRFHCFQPIFEIAVVALDGTLAK